MITYHLNLRAYSFCAVFLFRFINRNRNRRVQTEQFYQRGTISMVTKWRTVWFQTGKVKSTKKVYENEVRKIRAATCYVDKLLVFADRVIFFIRSRQSSSLSSWIPSGNGELLLFWQASFSKGKWWERCGTLKEEEEFVVLSIAAVVLRWKQAPKRLFSEYHEDKEVNENVDAPA